MTKLQRLSLHSVNRNAIEKEKQDNIRGGLCGCVCAGACFCGCRYAGSGGSSTNDNSNANADYGVTSTDDQWGSTSRT